MAGDPEGLARLLRDHGPRIRLRLQKDFGKALDDAEIDEAMSSMLIRLWHAAPRLDAAKVALRAWAIVLGRSCALRMLERRRGSAMRTEPDLDHLTMSGQATSSPSVERQRLIVDLHACIDALPRLQRAVLIADLEAGGAAPAEPLAREHRTTASSIYVSRQKARKALRSALAERGHHVGVDLVGEGVAPSAVGRSREKLEGAQLDLASLSPLQRKVLEADIQAGRAVSAVDLAQRLGTTPNAIYVSRSVARKALERRSGDVGSADAG